ncbi:MAG: hypothetical protein ACE5HT_15655 [Gemmatimonadales bacterium]
MSYTAIQLVNRAARARGANRLADAQRDLVETVALCRRSGTRLEWVRTLKALGQIERDPGHRDRAQSLYEEAVAICRDEGDPLTLAHAVRHLGDIHLDTARVEPAEACYNEALVLYRGHEQPPPLDLANAIRPLAILRESVGEVEEARRLRVGPEECYFWRTHAGAELDLLVVRGPKRLGFEFKRTDAPRVTPSMRSALTDLKLSRLYVVHAGKEWFTMGKRIEALPMDRLIDVLQPLR